MNENERQEFLKIIRKEKAKLKKSKAEAQKFLRDVGIMTKSNRLSKNYSHLCIPQGQG